MSSSDHLMKAFINRLSARIGSKVISLAAKLAIITEEAPEKIKKEWTQFKEEVNAEAERLNNENMPNEQSNYSDNENANHDPQATIDRIRLKISNLESLGEKNK